jgi:hypothetical protein
VVQARRVRLAQLTAVWMWTPSRLARTAVIEPGQEGQGGQDADPGAAAPAIFRDWYVLRHAPG